MFWKRAEWEDRLLEGDAVKLILGSGFADPFVKSTLEAERFLLIKSGPQAQVCDINTFKVIIWVEMHL